MLNQIDIDNLPEEPRNQMIILSDDKKYIRLGMADCILTVCRRNFKSTANGFYTFSHRKYEDQDLFFLNIYINNTLYVSNNPELRINRRRAIAHEFTHCVAAFLSLGRIRAKKLFEGLIKELGKRATVNAMEHFQSLLVQFASSGPAGGNELGIYPDEHFRLGYEDFDDSFMMLYKNFILDREIFEKYFLKNAQKSFSENIKAGNIDEASVILGNVLHELILKEAISAEFVNLRLKEELIFYYYQRAV
ncbi:hypothetical protein AGMMS50230_19360 [Spirochaetia bacterium]|nr:hypothetical protein AGMMS50230_19360 [Spirochaetia bacterium]